MQPYQIAMLEDQESKLYQEALYNNILERGNRGKYALDVTLQPSANTLALLDKNNVSIRDSWVMGDEELPLC